MEDLKVRKSELDNYLTEQSNNNARLLANLQNSYNQQVSNIQNDLRFNENDRNSAIRALTKAAQDRATEIKLAQMQLEQQMSAYNSQLESAWSDVSNYTPTTNDLSAINQTATSNYLDQSVNPLTASITERKKNGLLSDLNFGGLLSGTSLNYGR